MKVVEEFFADKNRQKEIKKSQVIVSLQVKKGEVLKKADGTSYQVADAKKLQVSYVSPSKGSQEQLAFLRK